MQITNISIKKLENNKKGVKAISTITIDNEFVIHDIKIIESRKEPGKLIIVMPSRLNKENVYKDICHPITSDCRNMLTKKVLEKFAEENN